MDDENKTRQQLIEELQTLRQQIGQREASEQQQAQTELLLRVSEATASTLERREIMRRIARVAAQGLGADTTGAYVPDETGDYLQVIAGYRVPPEKLARYQEYRVPLKGHAFVAEAWRSRKTVWSNDVPNDSRFDRETLQLFPAQSILATPMIAKDRPVGVLFAVWWQEAHPFSEQEERLVEGIVRQAAMAVENARLFQNTQQRMQELSLLFDTSRALAGGILQPQEIAEVLARRLVRFGNLECSFSLLKPDGKTLQTLADIRLEEDGTFRHEEVDLVVPLADYPVTARVMETLEPAIVQAADPDADPAELAYMRQHDVETLVIFPLEMKGRAIGVMEVEAFDERHFTSEQMDLMLALASQAAVALENVRLFDQAERRARGLQAAAQVSHAASSILEMGELLDTSVDLIRDHFDLYYVGLFLLNSQANAAVLQAGTGEAGRAMLAQGHNLEVGGDSMIGQCVALKEARIALDVGREAARFDNPLLPETRSEMALPLVARGEVIGALTVQSTQEAAFSDEDITVLQTMADQLANAIANARQFQLIRQARSETDKRVRELNCLSDIGQEIQRSPSVEALLTWVADRIPPAMQYPAHCVVAIEVQDGLFGVSEAKTLPWQVTQSLRVGDETLGRIYVGYTQAHDFLDEESALLGDIARRLSGYLESSHLFQETSSRAQSLALVNRVARAVGAIVNLDELMEVVYQEISTIYDTDAFFIALYDQDREELDFRFMVEKEERLSVGRLPLSGLASWVVREKAPLLIRNLEEERDGLPTPELVGSGHMAASWMGAPMLVGDQIIGIINMQSYRPNIWDEGDEQLFLTLVDQVAVAVSNTHLLENTRSRTEELAVLNEMARVLAARLDVEAAVESLYRHASRLIDTTNFYVALYHPQTDMVSFPLAFEHGERRKWGARRAGQGLTEYVIQSGEPLLMKENVADRLEELGIGMIGEEALSWLGVPMVRGEKVIGMIGVQTYTTPRLYNEQHRDLLSGIANQAAIAIQNARLFEQTQSALEETELLFRVARNLAEASDRREMFESTLMEYLGFLNLPQGSVLICDGDGVNGTQEALVRDGQPVEPGLRISIEGNPAMEKVIATRKAVAIDDALESDLVQPIRGAAEELGYRSLLLAPIIARGRVVGALRADALDEPHEFTQREIALVQAIADQLAIAMDNQRLLEEAQLRAEETSVLNQLAHALTARLNVDQVLEQTYHGVSRLLDTTNFYIGLYDPDKAEVIFPLNVSESRIDRELERISVDEGITGYIIRHRTSVLIREDVRGWLRERGMPTVGEPAASWLGVPLVVGDQVLGVMAVQDYAVPHAYDEHDRDLMMALASQAAIALQNALLFEEVSSALAETEDLARELAVLNDLSRTLTAQLDVEQILEEAYLGASQLLDAVNFYVTRYDSERDEITFALRVVDGKVEKPGTTRPKGRGGLTEYLIDTRRPLLIPENVIEGIEALGLEQIRLTQGRDSLSWLGVPIMAGPKVLGTMVVLSYEKPRAYDEHDQELLLTIANQTASALQNASRFEQAQTALEQVQAVHQRYIRESWQDYLRLRGPESQPAYRYEQGRVASDETGDLPDTDAGKTIAVPLNLRGQPIGTLTIGPPPEGRAWGEEEIALAQAVSEQLTLAIENARLFEQTQVSAHRERTLRQVTERVRASADMETLLKTAAQEMRRALGADRVAVKLNIDGDEGGR